MILLSGFRQESLRIDLKGAFRAYEELVVGGVILNDFPSYRIDHMPYGGVKDSSFGRKGIRIYDGRDVGNKTACAHRRLR